MPIIQRQITYALLMTNLRQNDILNCEQNYMVITIDFIEYFNDSPRHMQLCNLLVL